MSYPMDPVLLWRTVSVRSLLIRERLSSSAPNRENIHMIHLPNRVFSQGISEAALKPCSRRWEDGFSMAEIQEKIREYIM